MHVSSQHAAIMNHKNSWLLIFLCVPLTPMNLHVQRINETLSLYNYECIQANQ